jgi:chromosomal replication initiator protein
VAYFIASRVKSNIRELEGCLIKLGAYSSLTGNPIDITLVKNVLKDLISDADRPLTVDMILKVISDYFGIKAVEIKGKKRTKEIANARQIAMYVSKQLTALSLSDIGRAFGGKDHATVIYACKLVAEKRRTDENLNKGIENIIRKLKVS